MEAAVGSLHRGCDVDELNGSNARVRSRWHRTRASPRRRGSCQASYVDLAVPDWVAPDRQQVVDCYRLTASSESAFRRGVAAALGWVLGLAPGPLTKDNRTVSPEAAEREFFVAGKVELDDSPLSVVHPPAAAQGIGRTLSWLLGWERCPPVDLPRRPPPTAVQLYEEAVAAEPWRYRLPEQQVAARMAAEREARRLARLAALADGRAR